MVRTPVSMLSRKTEPRKMTRRKYAHAYACPTADAYWTGEREEGIAIFLLKINLPLIEGPLFEGVAIRS